MVRYLYPSDIIESTCFEDNKVVKKEGVNMEEIADLLPKGSISEETAHIELETGQKVVMQKHGKYTTAALVNLHSIDMVKKLQDFANEISKIEGTEDITSSLISDIFRRLAMTRVLMSNSWKCREQGEGSFTDRTE